MRIHLLASPHTISIPEYGACAFTQKVLKFGRMLTAEGHHVIHYGNEASRVTCAEHVTVITLGDLETSYRGHDHLTMGPPNMRWLDHVHRTFIANTVRELSARLQKGDIVLATYGGWHQMVADALPADTIVIEPGIGYPDGFFADYKIFESYALLHAYQGSGFAVNPSNEHWYEAVIPIAFDPADFTFRADKEDYLLFVGRLNKGKGVHLAKQLAEKTKTKLIVAGHGPERTADTKYIEHVGVVDPKRRAELMAGARAVLCPSHYLEPFGAAQIEAMFAGTPVVSSDWGAFSEYNAHGLTGYRCRTFEHFEWAIKNTHALDPFSIRRWADRFSLDNIAPHYTDYFQSVLALDKPNGRGWYESRHDRETLDTAVFSQFTLSRPHHPSRSAAPTKAGPSKS